MCTRAWAWSGQPYNGFRMEKETNFSNLSTDFPVKRFWIKKKKL